MYALAFLSLALPLLPLPAAAAPVFSMAAADSWTIKSLSRACADDLSTCTWKFGVVREVLANSTITTTTTTAAAEQETPCEHVLVAQADGTPASQIRGSGPSTCGIFTVTSGWSDQFGAEEDKAFTTLSVVDYAAGPIVYPAYTDAQVAGGRVVEPDLSFPVQHIPTV